MSSSWCRLVVTAGAVVLVAMGVVASVAPATANTGDADSYLDPLTEAAATPTLNWADCQGEFVCATAQVPLDYHWPHGDQIDLALIKLSAADPGTRIGTLFVNFGGPGQSGVDRLRARARWPWLFSDELRSRFDVVSWDQRGVSRSAAVRCFADEAEQWRFLEPTQALPTDASGEQALFGWAADFGERCKEHAGPVIDHVSTANSARDLELLRRAVGDPMLTYHGISYGSQLGAIYANMFPSRVRAMVFDGSIDFVGNVTGHGSEGAEVPLNTRQDVPVGVVAAFDEFLTDCAAAGTGCAFSQGDPQSKWAAMAARRTSVTVDEHVWTYPELVVSALSNPAGYPELAELLQQLFDTGTADVGLLEDVTGSSPAPADGGDGRYLANREEAYSAIQCSDSTVPTDPAAYSRAAALADQAQPVFGRISVFDVIPCAFWQGRDVDRYTGPWNRRTAAPILVLNTRNDPATPLKGAYQGASELYRAGVVVTEGAGHTSMYVASACTERVKREYLFSGVLPPEGTGCSRDHSPFDRPPGQ